MARKTLLIAAAGAMTACSFVFDTSELHGEGGGGAMGGEGPTNTSSSGGGGAGMGGQGGAACACEPRPDILWLVLAEDAKPNYPPPVCPRGTVVAEGGLAGTLQDDSSQCGGPCMGSSRVKVSIDDTCGVAGDGVSNTGACDEKTLIPETPADTSLAINLEPLPCTLDEPVLVDMAALSRATACAVADAGCAPAAGIRRCVAASEGRCDDPCFGEPATVQAITDDRHCDGVLATCSPPVVGSLELHDDAACALTPTASWSVDSAAICPATPTPPLSPSPSYWRYTPIPQSCDAMTQPLGSVALGETQLALCCAPADGA